MTGTRELGQIVGAVIRKDEGSLQFCLDFDFGGTGQMLIHTLDSYDKKEEERVGTAFGCECIMRILEAVGVESWDELKGKEMWVIRNKEEHGTMDEMILGMEAPKYRRSAGRPFYIRELIDKYYPSKQGE